MNKYLKISLWVIAAVYLIASLAFVSKKQEDIICNDIKVVFTNSENERFIDKDDILELLATGQDRVLGKAVKELDLAKIEQKINDDPYIRHAEVYKTIDGEITVEAEQRVPVLRVINSSNKSYYIGQEGVLMPVLQKFQMRMIIANGNISYSPNFDTIVNIYSPEFDENKKIKVIRDLHTLINYINKDNFWLAQIQQIYITDNEEFELIPLVGDQIIRFGGIDRYEEKFTDLEAIYKKGLPSKGWNQFVDINLKFKNQVICSKAE